MANRFPLIVNPSTKKIEELVSGDNIDLTGNGLVANSTLGTSGQYLKTNGTTVVWDNPGDVYLTATQTVTNKTFSACILSGSTNTFTNIPNAALVNSGFTINGVTVSLGGSVTTPDNNTTYSISAVDGLAASEKIIRLTSGGNAGSGVTDDVSLVAGNNVTLSRTGDAITINSSFVDTNTVTRLKSSVGGVFQEGDITIAATGSSTVSQDTATKTITINSTYVDTITRLRVSNSGSYASGDFTFLQGGATTITDSGTGSFTISSQDTITRVKGGGSGTLVTGDVTITGGGDTTVTQSGNTITITTIDDDTITRLRGTTTGSYESGDVTIVGGGFTTVSQSGKTITISSSDTNTTYAAAATGGLALSGTQFSIKNSGNLVGSKLLKWDSANSQITNSIIEDNGSTVTIAGDLNITGVTTTIDTTNLRVADNEIELRRGVGLLGSNGGIRLNRTTDGAGVAQTFASLQWFESGAYWRTWDGSVSNRLVTETEIQTLTNKTLTSPILTSPTLGIATATTINGVAITDAASATLTIANNKTFTCNNTLIFSGTDSSNIAFGNGGTVAYTANTLSVFAATSSTQLRGIITDETGIGSLVFNTNPVFSGSIASTDTSMAVFNTAVTGINAFGAATQIVMGATTGTTTIRNNVDLDKGVILGSVAGDAITVNGTANFATDIEIRGIDVGRGGNAILGNMRIGQDALFSNTTGSQNTMVGYEAGYTINSGAGNVAIGYDALHDLSTGQYNIALGRSAVTNLLTGGKNIGLGTNTLEANTTGNANVCIGHYAGAGCTGTGNVLIGPADDENITNSTYRPPTPTGDRQLVIGSGTGTWIRGDSGFNVSFLQDVGVGGNVTIGGNLTVSGTTTVIDSTTIKVDDKNLELGDVQSVTFTGTVTNNSSSVTAVSATANLIPGMVVSISTAGISVPVGTRIASITGNTMTLTNNVSGNSGTASFNAVGPSDTSADGGGIILKGTTDKTFLWDDADDAWTSSEHMDLVTGKAYKINGTNVLTATSLGSNVTASSLTSVGSLNSLTVTGSSTFNDLITSGVTTVGSSALKIPVSSASGLANSTFNISKTVYGGLHFNTDAGTGGAARQAAITFRGNTSDEAQAGIYVINNNTIGTAMAFATTDNYTTGPQEGIRLNHLGNVSIPRGTLTVTGAINANGGVSLPDNNYLTFGTTSKLRIGYDGSTGIITNLAGSSLVIDLGTNSNSIFSIKNQTQTLARFYRDALVDGRVELYYNDSKKFETTSTGATVTGRITASSFGTLGNYSAQLGQIRVGADEFGNTIKVVNDTNINIIANNRININSGANTNGSDEGTTVGYFSTNGLYFPSGKGIDFSANANASGMTSELLDDYEEGTFTPSYSGGVGTITYGSARNGYYVKVGRMVTAWINIMTDAVAITNSATDLTITGLPFTSSTLTESSSAISIGEAARWTTNPPSGGQLPGNSTTINLYTLTYTTGNDPTTVKAGDMGTGAGNKNICRLVVTYMTDS